MVMMTGGFALGVELLEKVGVKVNNPTVVAM
jgi:hypothetical protein